jgi:hypothetical protein
MNRTMPKSGEWLKPTVYGVSRYVIDDGFLCQKARTPNRRVIRLLQQRGPSVLFPLVFNGLYTLIAYTLSLLRTL